MDGKPVQGFPDLGAALQGHRAGDTIPMTLYRGAKKMTLKMELSRRPIPEVPLDPAELATQGAAQHRRVRRELAELFTGVSEREAGFRAEPDGWSAKDTLAHLIESEYRNLDFIQDLLQDNEREFPDEGGNVRLRLEEMKASAPTVALLLQELMNRQPETIYLLQGAGPSCRPSVAAEPEICPPPPQSNPISVRTSEAVNWINSSPSVYSPSI